MAAVKTIYNRIIHSEESLAEEDSGIGEFHLRPLELGAEISNDHVLRRLAEDSPALYEIASRRDLSARQAAGPDRAFVEGHVLPRTVELRKNGGDGFPSQVADDGLDVLRFHRAGALRCRPVH